MKAFIISSLYGINGGGAGIIAQQIAEGLVKAGHHVSVITCGGTRNYSITKERNLNIFRFRPINLYPLEEKDSHPFWHKLIWQVLDIYNFHCARVFGQILRDASPDIIHIHKMRGFSGAAWSVPSHLFPNRIIQTCHDYESMSPDGYMRGSIGIMALRQQWPISWYQLIRSRLSTGVSIVTAPSIFALKRVTRSGLFPQALPEVVPNTHGWSQDELRLIHRRVDRLPGDPIHFLYLGRLEQEKGIVQLCEAFTRAFNSNPAIKLQIAGWGTLEAELQQKYSKHPGISFLGAISGRVKEAALSDATILIVPSLWEEVFGVVVVEAFAFGKPVLGSNIGGLPELIRPGETGWLVEAGNTSELAEHLLAVSKMDQGLLAKMSRICKEYSYQFTIEKTLSQYLGLYGWLKK